METIILTPNEFESIIKKAVKDALNEFTSKKVNKTYFDDELLTRNQVEKILKISKNTFYNYVNSGKLKAVKIRNGEWRVKFKDLQELMYND